MVDFNKTKGPILDTQLSLILIPHEVENAIIPQRMDDGYVNATAMCSACGKKLSHYLSNQSTADFLAELEADAGIPASALVIVRKRRNTC